MEFRSLGVPSSLPRPVRRRASSWTAVVVSPRLLCKVNRFVSTTRNAAGPWTSCGVPALNSARSAEALAWLRNCADQQSWQEFNDFYAQLIFRFAIKAGCTETEADEVVQETLIAVSRNLPGFRYDPKACSFRTWLLNLSTWRIRDQMRKRLPGRGHKRSGSSEPDGTAMVERLSDPAANQLEGLWDQEWQAVLLEKAVSNVKARVDPKQWQVFDLYVLNGEAPLDVGKLLSVSIGRVYLTKHRIGAILKKEIARLKKQQA